MFNRLTDSSFILEMMVANIFFPIVVALLKAVVNYTSNGVLVSKYDDERANHYLYVFMLKLWKTTALPMGIYIVMSIILSSNEYEVTLDAALLAVGSILFSVIVFWLFLTSLNMKRIGIMLKAILTAVISNMVLIVLSRRFAPNVLDRWVLIMWACIQIVILEILLYEDGYYNDLSSNCFQIMEWDYCKKYYVSQKGCLLLHWGRFFCHGERPLPWAGRCRYESGDFRYESLHREYFGREKEC